MHIDRKTRTPGRPGGRGGVHRVPPLDDLPPRSNIPVGLAVPHGARQDRSKAEVPHGTGSAYKESARIGAMEYPPRSTGGDHFPT
jgi:hypothetical protein